MVLGEGGWRDSNNLWLLSADGTGKKKLTEAGFVETAIWCEGGKTILFAARTEGRGDVKLWCISAAGRPPELIFENGSDNYPTDWIPGRNEFAFSSFGKGDPKVYLMSLDSEEITELKLPTGHGHGARWSPDGKQISFLSNNNPEKTTDIYVMSTTDGSFKRLTNERSGKSWPDWSPDGKVLVCNADRADTDVVSIGVEKQ